MIIQSSALIVVFDTRLETNLSITAIVARAKHPICEEKTSFDSAVVDMVQLILGFCWRQCKVHGPINIRVAVIPNDRFCS